jgi:hypothetical protein
MMEKKSSGIGNIARTAYVLFIILIVGSIIVVWARASLVGILVAIFMLIMLAAIAWAIFRKRAGRPGNAEDIRSEESKQRENKER